MKKTSEILTCEMAGSLVGVTADYIRHLIAQGKIKAKKIGCTWTMQQRDVIHIKRQRMSRKKENENGSN